MNRTQKQFSLNRAASRKQIPISWSFSREDEAGRVVEVREKEPISCWASTGTYYFASGAVFVKLAESRILVDQAESGEFYVAPLYNDVIANGGLVKNYVIERLFCFGTPLDLEESLLVLNNKD